MKEKNDRLERFSGGNAGMTVPEGFFENFNKQMAESLPKQPWEENDKAKTKILPRSRWQVIRPYVYLAAMFMGIWCMMKMFNLMQSPNSVSEFETNAVLMSAIDNDAFYYDYCVSSISEADMYDELYETGFNPGDISEDIE